MGEDTSSIPGTVLIRYANLLDAQVIVMDPGTADHWRITWFCQGCMDSHNNLSLTAARTQANDHATTCRALLQNPATTA